jgi:hypothetical protein
MVVVGQVMASRGSFSSAWEAIRDVLQREEGPDHVVAELKRSQGDYADGVQEVWFCGHDCWSLEC